MYTQSDEDGRLWDSVSGQSRFLVIQPRWNWSVRCDESLPGVHIERCFLPPGDLSAFNGLEVKPGMLRVVEFFQRNVSALLFSNDFLVKFSQRKPVDFIDFEYSLVRYQHNSKDGT